jgi:uncharacterized protein YdaU (DUF1376 family)
LNYYPFHIGDYLSATRHLSWEEDAAYRRLLDTYYTTEKPLPVELRAVCRLVLATTETQREAVKVVLEEFFELTDEGWRNSRADAEIAEMQAKQQKQRDKANKRWQKPVTEHGIAPAMPVQDETYAVASKSDADAMPPTPTPTPTPKEKRDIGSADAELSTKTITSRMLVTEGIDKQSADDWLTLRKAKRLPLTPTAWDDTKAEGAKVGLTPAQTVAHAVRSNWAGFKASWYVKDNAPGAAASAGIFAGAI